MAARFAPGCWSARRRASCWRGRCPTMAASIWSPRCPGSARRTGGPKRAGLITRDQLRHHPGASRPRRAGGAGAPGPRPDEGVRGRRREMGAAADRRRDGRQRLAGAGPGRHARPDRRAARRWSKPPRWARRCWPRSVPGFIPTWKPPRPAMRGEVTRFEPKMSTSDRQRRLDGWKSALSRVLAVVAARPSRARRSSPLAALERRSSPLAPPGARPCSP